MNAVLSRDGKRLYVCSNRKLKIIDIPDGSTSIKEIPGNAQCNGVTRAYGSDKLLIGTASDDDDSPYTIYFMADYDGNIDKVADGNKIYIYNWGENWGKYFLALTGENYDTIVIDPNTGKQIRYLIKTTTRTGLIITTSRETAISCWPRSQTTVQPSFASSIPRQARGSTVKLNRIAIASPSSSITTKNLRGLFRYRRPHEDAHRRLQVEYQL